MEIGEGITIGNITYSDDLATVLSANKDITSFELIRGVRVIGTNAFAGCRNLRVVRIPETVIRIEDYAFRDCTYIRDLYLPFYIEYISPLASTLAIWHATALMLSQMPMARVYRFPSTDYWLIHVPLKPSPLPASPTRDFCHVASLHGSCGTEVKIDSNHMENK